MTAAPFQLDADWKWLLGNEAVILYRQQADESYDAGATVAHAVLADVRKSASGDDPRVTRRAATWLMSPAEAAPGLTPDPVRYDVVEQADGTRWQVQTVNVHPMRSAFEVEAVEEVT